MKKLISLLLVITVCLSLAVPAVAAEDQSELNTYKHFYFPMPSSLGGAELVDDAVIDGTRCLMYKNADMDAVSLYLMLCPILGLYPGQVDGDDELTRFLLVHPGADFYGKLLYSESDGVLLILIPQDALTAEDDALSKHLEYFEQDVSFPADMGEIVFPQFFASIGLDISSRPGRIAEGVFKDKKAWAESYSAVFYGQLQKYVDEMVLCGFEVSCVYYNGKDSDGVEEIQLLFSNGEAHILISYKPELFRVEIYYESGITWTLLSGADYARYIPQR